MFVANKTFAEFFQFAEFFFQFAEFFFKQNVCRVFFQFSTFAEFQSFFKNKTFFQFIVASML